MRRGEKEKGRKEEGVKERTGEVVRGKIPPLKGARGMFSINILSS
jgi:hypothetical protein